MNAKAFLDTNIFLYSYSGSDPRKKDIADELYMQYFCCSSVQALNEFCNVCIKKWNIDRSSIEDAIDEICSVCEMIQINEGTIKKGLYLHEKYRYAYYDCLMLASALESGCKEIFTEGAL